MPPHFGGQPTTSYLYKYQIFHRSDLRVKLSRLSHSITSFMSRILSLNPPCRFLRYLFNPRQIRHLTSHLAHRPIAQMRRYISTPNNIDHHHLGFQGTTPATTYEVGREAWVSSHLHHSHHSDWKVFWSICCLEKTKTTSFLTINGLDLDMISCLLFPVVQIPYLSNRFPHSDPQVLGAFSPSILYCHLHLHLRIH